MFVILSIVVSFEIIVVGVYNSELEFCKKFVFMLLYYTVRQRHLFVFSKMDLYDMSGAVKRS